MATLHDVIVSAGKSPVVLPLLSPSGLKGALSQRRSRHRLMTMMMMSRYLFNVYPVGSHFSPEATLALKYLRRKFSSDLMTSDFTCLIHLFQNSTFGWHSVKALKSFTKEKFCNFKLILILFIPIGSSWNGLQNVFWLKSRRMKRSDANEFKRSWQCAPSVDTLAL